MVSPSIASSDSALNFFKVTLIMGVNHHKLLHVYLITVDLLAMAFSFLVAASAVVPEVDGVPFTQFFSIRISILNVLIFWGFASLWYIVLALSGAYYVRRLTNKKNAIINIIQITSLGSLILIVFSVIFNIKLVTPLFLLVFWLMTTSHCHSQSYCYQVYHKKIMGPRHQSAKCGHCRHE